MYIIKIFVGLRNTLNPRKQVLSQKSRKTKRRPLKLRPHEAGANLLRSTEPPTTADLVALGMVRGIKNATANVGLPLGLAIARFWIRKHFNGTVTLKKKFNPTRIPIEPTEGILLQKN